MAKLYRRGACYYLDWREGGQRFRRSLGQVTREAAEAVQAEKEAELHGLITPTRGVTVNKVLDGYLIWYRKARPTTYGRAVSALKPFKERFGMLAAEGVDAAKVEDWEVGRVARSSANKAVKLAKAAFRRAIRLKVLRINPLEAVRPTAPPISRAPDYYRPHQLKTLYDCARGPLWRFMANTGVRRGEMAKARRSDASDGMLYVESIPSGRTKSGKWRAIPLNADAKAALAMLENDRLVTCDTADTLSDWFKEDAVAAKLPGSLHWLRHTFCTALVQSGVSLYDVKILAGHSSITVTEKYAHHAPSYGKQAVKALESWSRGHTMGTVENRVFHVKRKPRAKRPRSSAG